VTSNSPVRLTVDQRVLITLARVFAAAEPWEGCALLLGDPGPCTHVRQIWPCLNVWPVRAERHRRFALDPREQLQAQRWSRRQGLAVLGSAHSHPCGQPRPSRLDLALTVAPALVLIAARDRAAQPDQDWVWQFWWLDDPDARGQAARVVPLPWTMADWAGGGTGGCSEHLIHASS